MNLIPQARAILSRAERKSLEPPDDDEDLEAEIERVRAGGQRG